MSRQMGTSNQHGLPSPKSSQWASGLSLGLQHFPARVHPTDQQSAPGRAGPAPERQHVSLWAPQQVRLTQEGHGLFSSQHHPPQVLSTLDSVAPLKA